MSRTYREGKPEIRPNIYHRYTAEEPEPVVSYDGRVGLLFQSDWGPVDDVTVITDIEDVEKNYGNNGNVEIIRQAFRGGATEVYCQRLQPQDMEKSTVRTTYQSGGKTGEVEISAKYPGDRNLSVQIKKNLRNPKRKDVVVSDGGEILETVYILDEGKGEVPDFLESLNNSKYLQGKLVVPTATQSGNRQEDQEIERVLTVTKGQETPGTEVGKETVTISKYGFVKTKEELNSVVGAGESEYIDHDADVFYFVFDKKPEDVTNYALQIEVDGKKYIDVAGDYQYHYIGLGKGSNHNTDVKFVDDGSGWKDHDKTEVSVEGKTVKFSLLRYDETPTLDVIKEQEPIKVIDAEEINCTSSVGKTDKTATLREPATVSYEQTENGVKATVEGLPEGYVLKSRVWLGNAMVGLIPGRIDTEVTEDTVALKLGNKAAGGEYTLEVRALKAGTYTTLGKVKVNVTTNDDLVNFGMTASMKEDVLYITYNGAAPEGYEETPVVKVTLNGGEAEEVSVESSSSGAQITFNDYKEGTYKVEVYLKKTPEETEQLISSYQFSVTLGEEYTQTPDPMEGSVVQEVAALYLTGGSNGTVDVNTYSEGLVKLGKYRVNTIAVDSTDSDVQILAQEFVNNQNDAGKFCILVLGLDPELDIISGMEQAWDIDDRYVVLVGNGYFDAKGRHFNGFLMAAQIAGMIAAYPTNQSITHKIIQNAVKLDETYTNEEYEDCLTNGLLMLSLDELDNIVVDCGINTLHTLVYGIDDAGWKKIKRVKTRLEIYWRVTIALTPCIGNIVNDPAGRGDVLSRITTVLENMFNENKIADDYEVVETDEITGPDSISYDIRVYDYDMLEKYYLHYIFRYQK